MSVSYDKAIFNAVFLTQLIPYLTPISYLMLRRAHPRCFADSARYPSVASLCMKRCERLMLDVYGFDPLICAAILRALDEGKILLTGGCLLALVEGEPFDPATQEMGFVCTTKDPNYDSILGRREGLYSAFTSDTKFVLAHWADCERKQYEVVSNHESVRVATVTFYLPQLKPGQSLLGSLFAAWDLSFCAMTLSAGTLFVNDWKAVLHKRCTLDFNCYLGNVSLSDNDERVRNIFRSFWGRIIYNRRLGYDIHIAMDCTPATVYARIGPWQSMLSSDAQDVMGFKPYSFNLGAYWA